VLKFGLMSLVRLKMCFLNVESIFICKILMGSMQNNDESWSLGPS